MIRAHLSQDERPEQSTTRKATRVGVLFPAIFFLLAFAQGSTITGRVTNGTTGQVSPGDEVILFRVDGSMHEEGRARTDARGIFRFEDQDRARYLVAVSHQKVSYHTRVMSGTDTFEVVVYDAVPKLEEIRQASDTVFFETRSDTLTVTEFFVLSNQSSPTRTLSADNTFDFALPRRAVLDSVAIQPPGTLPLRTRVWPCGQEDRYRVAYPIRPGVTKIRVVYHVPYFGTTSVKLTVLHPVAVMALMVPKSMNMANGSSSAFRYNGEQDGLSVYVTNNLQPGASPSLILSGTGRLRTRNVAIPMARTTNVGAARKSTALHPFVTPRSNHDAMLASHRTLFRGCAFLAMGFTALLIATSALKKKDRISAEAL
jgi:hypothetical protein